MYDFTKTRHTKTLPCPLALAEQVSSRRQIRTPRPAPANTPMYQVWPQVMGKEFQGLAEAETF